MAALLLMNLSQMRGVAVLDVDPSAANAPAEQTFNGTGHGGAGLPCPDDLDAVESFYGVFPARGCQGAAVEFQMTEDRLLRIGCGERGAEDLQRVFPICTFASVRMLTHGGSE
jgi:hypothetical protein